MKTGSRLLLQWLRAGCVATIVIAGVMSTGCATYSEVTADARKAAATGNYQEAVRIYDKRLGVKQIDIRCLMQ